MTQFVSSVLDYLATVPGPIVYGVAALWMLMESLGIGLPIEPILIFVGVLSIRDNPLDTTLAFLTGLVAVMLGTCVGACVAFLVGRRLGKGLPRFGHYIGLTPERIDHLEVWMQRRGFVGVVIARLLPVVRSLMPYVIGAARVPFLSFLGGTIIGALLYNGLWAGLGLYLGDKYKIALGVFDQLGTPGAVAVVAGLILLLVYHFVSARIWWQRFKAHFHRHGHKHVRVIAS